jgi:glycosyltransferase involved in cell wall biosynthesis
MASAINENGSASIRGKAKILFLITKSNWGGAQKYVYELAAGLPKDSFECSVGFGGAGELTARLEAAGIRTISIPSLGRNVNVFSDIAAFFRLVSLLRKERPDIVHVNSSKIGGMGGLAARIAGVSKIIFTAHGWAFNEDRSEISRILIRFLHGVTIFLSHKTIAVSEAMKRDMDRPRFIAKKIAVIHNGIAPIAFKSREEARTLIGEKAFGTGGGTAAQGSERGIWIGTISELHRNKGLEYAIEAVAALHKDGAPLFSFFIIGEGEEQGGLEALIKKHGLENQVFLLGAIPDAARLLKAFDIFTLTSITEALAYVVLEAGQAGLPAVTSAVGGVPEIISTPDLGVLVRPRNVKEISLALKTLLSDESLRKNLGEALQKRVSDEFSFEKMMRKTIETYRA